MTNFIKRLKVAFHDWMLREFDLFVFEVNIGVAEHLNHLSAHGKAFVTPEPGRQVEILFRADKPELLDFPTHHVIANIFQQLVVLGHQPIALEFNIGGRHQNYRFADYCQPIREAII